MTLSPQSVPVWPTALKDETPLPFSAWRIMHLVDGQRTAQQIVEQLGLSLDDLQVALEEAENWTNRAVQREKVMTDAMIATVSQCLISVVGPMGEFMVDDALDEIGEHPTLSQVLGNIATQLHETHLHAFVRQLRSKGLA
ncbi:hypothetical protein [Deinococcus sp.]|uniref:hypothetical protein n=1 Tax=Deinococcus sp. TaxID=47478 RepID=UPI0025BC0A04|nr:hypothetical protein [Deinococcus sp.]